ncbi:MAG: hypothetical protein JNN01_11695 [Opitutaceae bacterium]|nr:hypothetical protein [Opitutaceae bacterium]
MDWILDHLQILVFFAGIIAYWINQRRREKAGESADYDGDGIPDTPTVRRKLDPNEPDPEEAERTRKIQEQIRRKISERLNGEAESAGPPPLVPVPSTGQPRTPPPDSTAAPRPASEGPIPDVIRRVFEPVRDTEAEARHAAERAAWERQRQLQAQLATLEAQRQAELTQAASVRSLAIEAETRKEVSPSNWIAELRGAKNLKRAVVVREVLGTPAGLR